MITLVILMFGCFFLEIMMELVRSINFAIMRVKINFHVYDQVWSRDSYHKGLKGKS